MTQDETFDTYAGYQAALSDVLGRATRDIAVFDPDLYHTGLESTEGIALLEAFCMRVTSEESLRIALHATNFLERDCPRLLTLLSRFGHRMQVRVTTTGYRQLDQPFVIVDGIHLVTRFHADRPRGKCCLDDPQSAFTLLTRFEEIWLAARRGPAGTPLGI